MSLEAMAAAAAAVAETQLPIRPASRSSAEQRNLPPASRLQVLDKHTAVMPPSAEQAPTHCDQAKNLLSGDGHRDDDDPGGGGNNDNDNDHNSENENDGDGEGLASRHSSSLTSESTGAETDPFESDYSCPVAPPAKSTQSFENHPHPLQEKQTQQQHQSRLNVDLHGNKATKHTLGDKRVDIDASSRNAAGNGHTGISADAEVVYIDNAAAVPRGTTVVRHVIHPFPPHAAAPPPLVQPPKKRRVPPDGPSLLSSQHKSRRHYEVDTKGDTEFKDEAPLTERHVSGGGEGFKGEEGEGVQVQRHSRDVAKLDVPETERVYDHDGSNRPSLNKLKSNSKPTLIVPPQSSSNCTALASVTISASATTTTTSTSRTAVTTSKNKRAADHAPLLPPSHRQQASPPPQSQSQAQVQTQAQIQCQAQIQTQGQAQPARDVRQDLDKMMDAFPAEMLLDLAGSTSAEVRRMNEDERALVHYKRRLRNRESAKRSRARRQATIGDIQTELEELRQVTSHILDRCMSFARTNQRQEMEIVTLRKEKSFLETLLRSSDA